jgi:hypothetical protein
MEPENIAVFLNPMEIHSRGRQSLICRADIELVNELALRFHVDAFCDDPLPLNRHELRCPLNHSLIFQRWLRKQPYKNILYLLWSSGIHDSLYNLIEYFPGVIVLRDAHQFNALSRHYVFKKDYKEYLNVMTSNFGRAGRVLATSHFLKLPHSFLGSNIPVERYFAKRARRLVVNYDSIPPGFQSYTIHRIPHHAAKFVGEQKRSQAESFESGTTYRLVVQGDVIPPLIVQIIVGSCSLLAAEGFFLEIAFLGEMQEPVSLEEWQKKEHFSRLRISNFGFRTDKPRRMEIYRQADAFFTFNSYNPYISDTLCSNLLTAKVTGKPVITFGGREPFLLQSRGFLTIPAQDETVNHLVETIRPLLTRNRSVTGSAAQSATGPPAETPAMPDESQVVEEYCRLIRESIPTCEVHSRETSVLGLLRQELVNEIDSLTEPSSGAELKQSIDRILNQTMPLRIDRL